MAKKLLYLSNSVFLGLLLLGVFFSNSGCKDEFTNDPDFKLSMPDSLRFDTVISQTNSPTAEFKIYNRTKEDIKIASIVLDSKDNFFKINVNGKSGTSFSNVEIRSGDSLYVFVQIVVEEIGDNAPLFIEDRIKFMYNGNCQDIVLSAYGQDACHIRERLHISHDTSWTNEKPFLIYDSIIVDSAVTLTIKEGTILYMKKMGTICVDGSLIIDGSANNEVVFRTDRNKKDYYSKKDNLLYEHVNNQWGGIYISPKSSGNRINHAFIMGGAFGIEVDSTMADSDDYSLVISNSHIHNTYGACLGAYCTNVLAYNSVFTNGKGGAVILQGGKHQFDHCTISNHNLTNCALILSDMDSFAEENQEVGLPFKAVFNNCIVAGDTSEIDLPRNQIRFIPHTADDSLDYRFDHSLISMDIQPEDVEKDTVHFNVVILNEKPCFQLIDNANHTYDFHLREDSPCRERGDLGLVLRNEAYKTDKDGVVRDVIAAPDMGAYQTVVKMNDEEAQNDKGQ